MPVSSSIHLLPAWKRKSVPRELVTLTSRALRSLDPILAISVAIALWSAVNPPLANDSTPTPGIDAILAPSLEAVALALV